MKLSKSKMNAAMQLRILSPADRLSDLRKVSRLVGRAMTMAMQLHRASDAERPTRIADDAPRVVNKKDGKEYPDYKAIFGAAVELYTYPIVRRAFPEIGSHIIGSVCRDARQKYFDKRMSILAGGTRTPEWTKPEPIPIRDGRSKLVFDGTDFRLTFQLYAKDQKQRPIEALVMSRFISDEWRAMLHEYASGKRKLPRVLVHVGRRKTGKVKWFVDIPYAGETCPHRLVEGRTMYVRRPKLDIGAGFMRCTLLRTRGADWTEDVAWDGALRAKEGLERRRKAISNEYRCSAGMGGRIGHGRDRATDKGRALTRKLQDTQQGYNYKWALYLIETAVRWKCDTIEIEDLTLIPNTDVLVLGAWNYHQIYERLAMLCRPETHGITLKRVKPIEAIDPKEKETDSGSDQRTKTKTPAKGRHKGGGVQQRAASASG